MAGHETFNKSPNVSLSAFIGPEINQKVQDIRLLGQAQMGVYRDDCEGLHPDTIEKYYGVLGAERVGQPGAGNPPDEDAEPPSLAERIGVDQGPQVRHDAIDVPDHRSPFLEDSDCEATFFRVLEEVVRQEITPAGYGLLAEEWDEDGYPDVEMLGTGKQMKTKIQVSLAHPIWAQRARFWVQGLNVLSHFNLYVACKTATAVFSLP
jgi:hypothetical protein